MYPLHDRLHFLSMVQFERQYEGWPDRRDTPVRRSWVLSLALLLPWASHLIFLSLHFFICKIGVRSIIAPT